MTIETIFTNFPRLETEHLILRQIQLSDAAAVFATFSDEAVMEFYGEIPHRSVEESRDLIRRQHEWYRRREGIRWGITRRGDATVIGSCGFSTSMRSFSAPKWAMNWRAPIGGRAPCARRCGQSSPLPSRRWGCAAWK
ncbi:MAG TPA: GNAT family N-acetyltransferase, partial [Ktedonobacterales bacterium]